MATFLRFPRPFPQKKKFLRKNTVCIQEKRGDLVRFCNGRGKCMPFFVISGQYKNPKQNLVSGF
jgi:hypothetical protein